MPLIYSKAKKAVGENIKKEEEAGKPHKQAIAIALAVQRKARAKKMAHGGEVAETEAPQAEEEEMDDESLDSTEDSGEDEGEEMPEEDKHSIIRRVMERISK